MTRRRRRLLLLLAAAAVLGVVALPAVHWRLIGWVRGELFYLGRPTSYYASLARRTHPPAKSFGRPELWARNNLPAGIADAVWGRPPFSDNRWGGSPPTRGREPTVEAVPVLAAMARDPDPRVRRCAALALAKLHEFATPAVHALTAMLDDDEPDVRLCASIALGRMGESARFAVPRLRQLTGDGATAVPNGPTVGQMASRAVASIEADALKHGHPPEGRSP